MLTYKVEILDMITLSKPRAVRSVAIFLSFQLRRMMASQVFPKPDEQIWESKDEPTYTVL